MKSAIVLCACLLTAPIASALNNRSAVSISGLDSNPCTPASPCRSFTSAIAATSAGGEVIALDSGGYGPFSIGQTMTISGAPGVHAAITVTASYGITINAGLADRVILRNLVLIGGGGTNGIRAYNAAEVDILDCLIRGFTNYGIYLVSDNPMLLLIDGTGVFDCAIAGINTAGDLNGANLVDVTVSNCSLQSNSDGLWADYGSRLVVTNTTITGNLNSGVMVRSNTNDGLTSDGTVEGCTIAYNGTGVATLACPACSARVSLARNMIAYNTTGLAVTGPAVAHSFGNNRFAGNNSDGPAMTPAAFK